MYKKSLRRDPLRYKNEKKNICKLKIFIERRFFDETKKGKIINGNTL